jgi:hypothetical protein
MVRAILVGKKTQTRRVLKPQPEKWVTEAGYDFFCGKDQIALRGMTRNGPAEYLRDLQYVKGQRLWVREKFLPDPPIDGWDGDFEWHGCGRPISGVPAHYRAPDYCLFAATWNGSNLAWRPSIHMPRWASRITLEVMGIRVERVQQISYADALAEGVWRPGPDADPDQVDQEYDAKFEYRKVWDEINAERGFGWDSNPWVFVIEFRRIEAANTVLTGLGGGLEER